MLTNQDILVFYRFFFLSRLGIPCLKLDTALSIWHNRRRHTVHHLVVKKGLGCRSWIFVVVNCCEWATCVWRVGGGGGARMKTMPDSVRRLVCWPAPTALHRRQGVDKLKVDPGWIVSKLHQIRHYVCSPLPIHKSSVKPMRWRVFRDMRATDRQGFLSQLDC